MAIKFIKAMLNKTQQLMRKEDEEASPFKELEKSGIMRSRGM